MRLNEPTIPFSVAVGTRLNDRYVIKKVVNFDATGGLYLARDQNVTDGWCILKEFIPPVMSDHELANRRQAYKEVIHTISEFRHPNLARVYEAFWIQIVSTLSWRTLKACRLRACSACASPLSPLRKSSPGGSRSCDALA